MDEMKRYGTKYEVGQHVKYVNQFGVAQDALITIWWAGPGQTIQDYVSATGEPGCNLVICSTDAEKKDSCGRQTERETSVVHKTKQAAHGRYWCWPDEL
jgi:hypothetical protein